MSTLRKGERGKKKTGESESFTVRSRQSSEEVDSKVLF